jgi:hypothetical protein
MKAYDLNTPFTFGKYEGKTLEEVFDKDPSYIEKCMISVDDFSLDEKSLQLLFEKYPDHELSNEAIDKNLEKLDMDDDADDLDFPEELYEDDFDDDDEFTEEGEGEIEDFNEDEIEDDIEDNE